MSLISLASLGSGYFILKSKALADKQRDRAAGDYTVTVDRSGTKFPYCLPGLDVLTTDYRRRHLSMSMT
jgi:hypothetical protein